MKTKYTLTLLALTLGAQMAGAQSLKLADGSERHSYLTTSKDTVEVDYAAGFNSVAVMGNSDYKVTKQADADWLSFRKEANGNLTVFSDYNTDVVNSRYATLQLTSEDGKFTHNLVVRQLANSSVQNLNDIQLVVASATASSAQSGYPASYAIDGNTSTYWHTPWGSSSYNFPFTFTLTLKEASHVDYVKYISRNDGSVNGNWGEVVVSYATADAPSTWVEAGTYDFGQASGSYEFGEDGVDNVLKIKFEIKSAGSDNGGNFASAAEVQVYQKDQDVRNAIKNYFTSDLCNELKSGVTAEQVATITNPYLRVLASNLLSGNYSTEYRVGTFNCYNTRGAVQSMLKTSSPYDAYENPTGIIFNEGDKVAVFAEGIDSKHPVQLIIKNFSNADRVATEGQAESYYSLSNGLNIITASNRGNSYVSYYSTDFENAPEVKLHFALAREVGCFKQGMTNAQWKQILANAEAQGADNIDVLSNRLHVVVPFANVKNVCPENGEKLVTIYDQVVYREREIMGLPQLGIEPKNHQFARPVNSGMFADGMGAAASFGSFNEWCNPESFGFWGIGHELGHINQITPGFKWGGLGETTNNIYSAWVEHTLGATDKYGNGYHRLEDESSGIDDYQWTRGGRFEAYLEEGVRKGVSWQLQDGPDYHGNAKGTNLIADVDENGNSTGKQVESGSRNYDHFLKVIPFWQLELYTLEVGANAMAYPNFIQSYRDGFNTSTFNTSGKQQMEMIRRFCNAAQINFCSFFEKAGLLKPIHAYIEDYSPAWLVITQDMCDAVKSEIAAKGYPEAPAALNYINAYNWTIFRDKTQLTEGTLGKGCKLDGTKLQVDNTQWPGAVGYETYDSKDNLLHISMFGLGDSQMSSNYTYVLFPSTAKYVMAVGYDGTKVKIYQK